MAIELAKLKISQHLEVETDIASAIQNITLVFYESLGHDGFALVILDDEICQQNS